MRTPAGTASRAAVRPGAIGWPLLFALLVAGLTLIAFAARAGGNDGDGLAWPVRWNLYNADNGVLYQYVDDLVRGVPLEWGFSGQVYTVPELPLNLLGYAIAGGDPYWYFEAVAVLYAVVLYLCALALVRALRPATTWFESALGGFVVSAPLLAFPFFADAQPFVYQLMPSYYFGAYVALLVAPILLTARHVAVRVLVGVLLALTVASNPLALLFAGVSVGAVGIVAVVRLGWRALLRPAAWVAGTLVAAGLARLAIGRSQGKSPLAYLDPEKYGTQLDTVLDYLRAEGAASLPDAVLLHAGVVLAAVGVAVGIAVVVRIARVGGSRGAWIALYLALLPAGSILAVFALGIGHGYYTWPLVVLPYLLAPLLVPPRWWRPAAAIGLAGIVLVAVVFRAVPSLTAPRWNYFATVDAPTACVDDRLPPGSTGVSLWGHARPVTMMSRAGQQLIPVNENGTPNGWLTNLWHARTAEPSFFLFDPGTPLPEIVESRFGAPDEVIPCGDERAMLIWRYTDPAKLAAIREQYRAWAPVPA